MEIPKMKMNESYDKVVQLLNERAYIPCEEKKTVASKIQKDEDEGEMEIDGKKIIAIAKKLVKLGEKKEDEVLVKAAKAILELCGEKEEEDEESEEEEEEENART